MKKYVTFSLFVFLAIVAGVFFVHIFSGNRQPVAGQNGGTNQKITGIDKTVTSVQLTPAELAKHNNVQSCWLLISGKIYDVTSYINGHPGGRSEILNNCGTDATAAFDTKGRPGGSPHSAQADSMLAGYYIGDLNQTAN